MNSGCYSLITWYYIIMMGFFCTVVVISLISYWDSRIDVFFWSDFFDKVLNGLTFQEIETNKIENGNRNEYHLQLIRLQVFNWEHWGNGIVFCHWERLSNVWYVFITQNRLRNRWITHVAFSKKYHSKPSEHNHEEKNWWEDHQKVGSA